MGVYNIERENNEDRFEFRCFSGSAGKHGPEINRPIQSRIPVSACKSKYYFKNLRTWPAGIRGGMSKVKI